MYLLLESTWSYFESAQDESFVRRKMTKLFLLRRIINLSINAIDVARI